MAQWIAASSIAKSRRAFTLIELLVVVAIIAVLISIMFPAIQLARQLAINSKCQTNQAGIAMAMTMYASSASGRIPPSAGGSPWETYVAYEGYNLSTRTGRPYGVGALHAGRLIEDPKVFYCPARVGKETHRGFNFEFYSNAVGEWPGVSGRIRTSYNFYPHNPRPARVSGTRPEMILSTDVIHGSHTRATMDIAHRKPDIKFNFVRIDGTVESGGGNDLRSFMRTFLLTNHSFGDNWNAFTRVRRWLENGRDPGP